MQAFLDEISKPTWWFTTVVIALVINVASAYIKPWLDVHYSGWRIGARKKKWKTLRQMAANVIRLANDHTALILHTQRAGRLQAFALTAMILSTLLAAQGMSYDRPTHYGKFVLFGASLSFLPVALACSRASMEAVVISGNANLRRIRRRPRRMPRD